MSHYSKEGAKGVQKRLRKKHSLTSIQSKAKRMGVKKGQDYERQELTQQLLKEIKAAYTSGKRGALKALAEKKNVNYQWLKSLASTHGIARTKYHQWCQEADEIITDNEGFCPHTISTRLKQAGYYYSISAIAKRMAMLRVTLRPDDEYNVDEISSIFGMHHGRVSRLIDSGKLKTRDHITANGHVSTKRYISTRHLRQFIRDHPAEIDLRKIDPAFQLWFIDLLTNRHADRAAG